MQQINLYLPEFQPNREPLRSIHMFWGLAAFIVLLVLLMLSSINTNAKLQTQLENDRTQLDALNTQLKHMMELRPQTNLVALDEEILALTNGLSRRQQIFGIVANKNLGNNQGFSEQIKALGRQSIDTVSLDVFSLQNGGTYVEFAGKALAADQIPLYLQKLRTEPAFAQVSFGVLNVAQSVNVDGTLEFSLAKLADQSSGNKPHKTAVQSLLELNQKAKGDQ